MHGIHLMYFVVLYIYRCETYNSWFNQSLKPTSVSKQNWQEIWHDFETQTTGGIVEFSRLHGHIYNLTSCSIVIYYTKSSQKLREGP